MSRQHDIEQLIKKHLRRRQKLEEQSAVQGISTPPDVLIEIEDITEKIAQLEVELSEIEQEESKSPSKRIRVAMLFWEIGRPGSGVGTKLGGLGKVAEELPSALVRAATQNKIKLDIE